MNLQNREDDKIREYLMPLLKNYGFEELSENFLKANNIFDILGDAQVPINMHSAEKVTMVTLGANMAFVIGCDPDFKYVENYKQFVERILDPLFKEHFDRKFADYVISEGTKCADMNDFDAACAWFRAALVLDPNSRDGLYCYARACKDSYELGEEEEFVARYKAESLEMFERLTMDFPDFADGFYFLGYAYLNLGLYIKAKLTWEDFLKLSTNKELISEVEDRVDSLEDPVKIEEGYNLIITGKFQEGYDILLGYVDGPYKNWWPLWYYLGVAAREMGKLKEAEKYFKNVLNLSPSDIQTLEELVKIYEELDDLENLKKYEGKIELVKQHIAEDEEIKKLGEEYGAKIVTNLADLPGSKTDKMN
ncbi:MAG: tetratricopeptide repeat protein [Clostridia bacterium]|nr:tetratricopeptide repeat protein [Clostridia bacterium]